MKTINNIQRKFLYGIVIMFAFVLASCEDDKSNEVVIYGIYTNQLDTESTQIISSYNEVWVRIEGSGFTGLQAIYCNGIQCYFLPTFVTDKYITFQISTNVLQAEDVEESVRGTIRVVTNHGEAIYRDFLFKDVNKRPSITNISHTLPEPGDVIFIEGNNLTSTSEVYFPAEDGEVAATEFTVFDARIIGVTVPAGVGNTSGAIRIVSNGDSFYSPNYMFYRKGMMMDTFTGDVMIAGGSSNFKVYANRAEIAAATGLSRNPEYAMSFGAAPADVPVAGNNNAQYGHFKFWGNKALELAMANSDGALTESTSMQNLAIQFDLYMLTPWTSGAIVLKIDKNQAGVNSQVIRNITPWNADNSYTFESGWRTITVKFSEFPSLPASTLGAYIDWYNTPGNRESLFGFYNFDVNNDGHTASTIAGFQMFMANIRMVPVTVPES